MKYSSFTSQQLAHEHSLKNVLTDLYQHNEFMESISSMVDLGCQNEALDLQWWANAEINDDTHAPLGIKCIGVNILDKLNVKHKGISFQRQDVQEFNQNKKSFDVLWCYDVLQYLTNPYQALANWWHIASQDAMMVIAVPQTTNVEFNMLEYNAQMNHKYHFTMPMLIYMLAVNGWDCKSGFFKKGIGDPWLYAIVYRSNIKPMDPAVTNLYNLVEDTELLPEVASKSIVKYGMLRQKDLLLPWLDKSNMLMAQQ
jgi:SAM-dependent methyltransferase